MTTRSASGTPSMTDRLVYALAALVFGTALTVASMVLIGTFALIELLAAYTGSALLFGAGFTLAGRFLGSGRVSVGALVTAVALLAAWLTVVVLSRVELLGPVASVDLLGLTTLLALSFLGLFALVVCVH
ncbi:hypothetical protein [Natronorarus salvus]|uniref:hypothetical protein n=1 Tax=Natronorarus salvus TaxID=3117733 RepID=UPI002F268E4A